eukprot:TRINITY_DN2924_c1_g1_i1.p1 TRINITY_DN2924_c1_g1~~TRINITY_DN2924_c1_g1_i1.p1  ORF type:complete len:536 (+),score=122.34 TRINITY_DN2924_c1_g1_i1:76-1608(+)
MAGGAKGGGGGAAVRPGDTPAARRGSSSRAVRVAAAESPSPQKPRPAPAAAATAGSGELHRQVELLQRQLALADARLRTEQTRREGAEQRAEYLKVQLTVAAASIYDADRRESPRAGDVPLSPPTSPGAEAAQRATWTTFVRACRPAGLSERDLLAVSEATLWQLLQHAGMDRDAVAVAHVELEWRRRNILAPQAATPMRPHRDASPQPRSSAPTTQSAQRQHASVSPPRREHAAQSVSQPRSASPAGRRSGSGSPASTGAAEFVVELPKPRPSFSFRRAMGLRSPASGAVPAASDDAPRRLVASGACSPMRMLRNPGQDVPLPPYSPGRADAHSCAQRSGVSLAHSGAAGAPSCRMRSSRRSPSPQPGDSGQAASCDPNAMASAGREWQPQHRRSRSADAARCWGHAQGVWDKAEQPACTKRMVCGPALTFEYRPRRHITESSRRIFGQEIPSTVASLGQNGPRKSLDYYPDGAEHRPRRTGYITHRAQAAQVLHSDVAECLSPGRRAG